MSDQAGRQGKMIDQNFREIWRGYMRESTCKNLNSWYEVEILSDWRSTCWPEHLIILSEEIWDYNKNSFWRDSCLYWEGGRLERHFGQVRGCFHGFPHKEWEAAEEERSRSGTTTDCLQVVSKAGICMHDKMSGKKDLTSFDDTHHRTNTRTSYLAVK